MALEFQKRDVIADPNSFMHVQHLYMRGTNIEIGARIGEYDSVHNREYLIDGGQQPKIITNFLLHRHAADLSFPAIDTDPNSAENRFRVLQKELGSMDGEYSLDFIRCTNRKVFFEDPILCERTASAEIARTLFHNIYDLDAGTVSISFYLGEGEQTGVDNANIIRSEYVDFTLSD